MRANHEIFENLVLAEASAWLTRLQRSSRTAAVDAAFKAWLAEDVSHARAFARVTETWDIIPGAARLNTVAARPPRRMLAAVAACLLLAVVVGGFTWRELRNPVYQTRAGEQRTVILKDGTRMTLNTDTRLAVDYSKAERRILLSHGEVIFDDVANPRRPFIVQAGDKEVRALGTVFDVHSNPRFFAVTLVSGLVEVAPTDRGRGQMQPGKATLLSPGERLTLHPDGHQTLDHPSIEEITAWERGEAMFDNATLADVIAELNRYGNTHIGLGDPALAQLRISGVFTTQDPVEAARAIAKLHHLNVVRTGESVVIAR